MAERKQRKTRIGKVVSDKMDKTVVVKVETWVRHPLFGRTIRRSKRFKAHDEHNEYRVGDQVRLVETRPLSKEKRWRVAERLSPAAEVESPGREDKASDPASNNAKSRR